MASAENDFIPAASAVLRDGQRIAVNDWATGDLTLQAIATLRLQPLTLEPYMLGFAITPRVSPVGARLAFTWIDLSGSGDTELRVTGIAGGMPRTIYGVKPTRWVQAEDRSPDGKMVLAWRDGEDGTVQVALVPVYGDRRGFSRRSIAPTRCG